jgi:hypothetical protein
VATDWWPLAGWGAHSPLVFLYTLYLAAVYGLFGYHLVARLIQAILGGLLMPGLSPGSPPFSPTVGLVAAGLTALYAILSTMPAPDDRDLILPPFCGPWTWPRLGQASHKALRSKLKISGSYSDWPWRNVLLHQVFLLFVPILFVWLLWRGARYQIQLSNKP